MSEIDQEYQDRISELDKASSPTIQMSISHPPGQEPPPQPQQDQGGLTPQTVQQMLRSFEPPSNVQQREQALKEFQNQTPPPEVQAVVDKPEHRSVLDRVLKTMTGVTTGEIQKAIEDGTLNKLVVPTAMKTADPFGNIAGAVAQDTAGKSGIDAEAAAKITGAATFFAGLLFPGFKGSKASRAVSEAAMAARETPGVAQAAGAVKRLVRVVEATTEEAKALAAGGGDLVIGNRAIKIDYSSVDTTGELDRILNRAAEVVHDEFVKAKRGKISDPQLANMAKQAGIDLPTLLARTPGEIFTVEKQMAAQMAAGQLGLRAKTLATAVRAGDVTAEEELRRTSMLLLSVVPQMMASTSEAARVTRIAGLKMPGVQEAKRTTEMLQLIATKEGELASGLSMRKVAEQIDALDTPAQVATYFRVLRALGGGMAGAYLGAEGGESLGGTPGAVAGGVAGGVLGAAAAVNPGVLMEAWINGLLSGTGTYAVNITTEMASTVNGVIERGIAASHGSVGAAERVVPGEAMVMTHAAVAMMWREFLTYAKLLASEPGKTATRAVAGAAAGAAVSDEDTLARNAAAGAVLGALARPGSVMIPDAELKQRAFSAEGLGMSGWPGRVADVIGSYLRAPSRGLVKADDFIKAMNIEMEMWAQAHRSAILHDLKPGSQDYANWVIDALRTPSSDTVSRAGEYAAYIAFQSETNRAIAGVTAGNPLLRVIAPFTFTPANLMSQSFERFPLVNRLSQQLNADLAAGGVPAQLARAKIDMGIAMTGLAWYLAAAGITHGHGSLNPEISKLEREVLKRQPYSFTPAEGVNVSFNRFDPWAMHFGLVATIYEMSHEMPHGEWRELLGAALVAGTDQWLSKSYLQNTAQFVDALTEFRRGGNTKALDKFIQGLAGSAVPTGVATLERVIDPKMREVDSVADAIRNRIPILSADGKPRYDFFGEPIASPHVGWEVLDAFNSFYVQQETADAKAKYIVNELKTKGIAVRGPSRVLGPGGDEPTIDVKNKIGPNALHLDDARFARLQQLFSKGVRIDGETLKDKLYSEMHSGMYRSLGPLGQQTRIKDLVSQFRLLAVAELRRTDRVLDLKLRGVEQQRRDLTTKPAQIAPGLVLPGAR